MYFFFHTFDNGHRLPPLMLPKRLKPRAGLCVCFCFRRTERFNGWVNRPWAIVPFDVADILQRHDARTGVPFAYIAFDGRFCEIAHVLWRFTVAHHAWIF